MAMPFRVDEGDFGDEFRELRPFPRLSWQTALRGEFASPFEGWFSDHFGLREPLIRLNAWVRVKLLSTSPTEDVIVGRDGMLFFHETLPDHQDAQPLTDDELMTIKANIAAIIDALDERGARLFLAIVPNKNSVYPEYMPAAYPRREGDGNIARLRDALAGLDVMQIDLLSPLRQAPERLYHLTDTHWNDAGARLAAEALLAAMDRDPVPDEGSAEATTYSGDLARMVGLKGILTEPDQRLIQPDGHDYSEHLLTVDAVGEGHLLVLRDSFGVAIGPFLTPAYEQTELRWQSPLEISGSPDDVLILIAERTIRQYLLEEPIINEPDESGDDDDYEELQRMRAEMQQEEG